ncbi:hypothetical protein JMA_06370 [Jeotgalibacillus malaysiensis]|uniref:Superoxide dismutase copper/zinc binding domain-containing protein n=1 Tax=Jeotgalibacillus malaysiensis TaxID=1508404 RepID=A0A0B5APE9_9BACL|nr:hypothetical protein JMA_06370 [Jeotgalibacillus malaysiensis]
MMKMYTAGLAVSLFAAGLAGCQMLQNHTVPASAVPAIESDMVNRDGERIGSAMFKQEEEGVLIQLTAKGLEPGEKAVHIHETGKCTPPDFESAGGHFNPAGSSMGLKIQKVITPEICRI